MKKALELLNKLFATVTVISVVIMLSIVLLQVFARFALPKAPSWTEELGRFFFIAAVAFAAPLVMKNREFVRVDTILLWLPKKVAYLFEVIIDIIIIIVTSIVAVNAVDFVKLGAIQKSSTLTAVPMSIPFSGILIATTFIVLYCILNLINDVNGFIKGGNS